MFLLSPLGFIKTCRIDSSGTHTDRGRRVQVINRRRKIPLANKDLRGYVEADARR